MVHATQLAGIVTRRPLVLQLHKIDEGGREYAEFLHLPRKRFTDFGTEPGSNFYLFVIADYYLLLLVFLFFFLNDCFIYNVKLFLIFVNIDNNVIAQLLWEKRFKMKPIERLDEQDRFQVFQFILAYILRMVCYINMSPRKNYM